MVKFTEIPLIHNWWWPTLMGLLAAVVTALSAGIPAVTSNGFQEEDWATVGGIVLSAAIGFGATIMQRYAGKREDWGQPVKEPEQDLVIVSPHGEPIKLLESPHDHPHDAHPHRKKR